MTSPVFNQRSLLVAGAACTLAALATHGFAQRGPNGDQRRGPPAEAIEACSGSEEGAACAFTDREQELQGTCFAPPRGGELACRPSGRSSRGQRGSQGGGSSGPSASGSDRRADRSERGGRSDPPLLRAHAETQSDGPARLLPATQAPIAQSVYTDEAGEIWRMVRANGVSQHATGAFPNPGNPHSIAEQDYAYRVPAAPQWTGETTSALGQPFGIAVNGVVFDPGANEFFEGNRRYGWQYEPLRDALNMGLDEHHAHVQAGGAYHYHGLPTGLLGRLGVDPQAGSVLVGWAADGFPIYALFAADPAGGAAREMTSSYVLRKGARPSGAGQPGGFYDGTFTRDYEYVAGQGTLDECNGADVVTSEFPRGTYAYFLTHDWPVIPRCYKGTPSADFSRRGPRNRRSPGA